LRLFEAANYVTVFTTAFTKKLVNLNGKVKIQGQLIEAFGIG